MGQTMLEYVPLDRLIDWAMWILVAEYLGAETHSKPLGADDSYSFQEMQIKVTDVIHHNKKRAAVRMVANEAQEDEPKIVSSVSVGQTVFVAPGGVQMSYGVALKYHETGVARSIILSYYATEIEEMEVGEKYIFFVNSSTFAPGSLELCVGQSYDSINKLDEVVSKLPKQEESLPQPVVDRPGPVSPSSPTPESTPVENQRKRNGNCNISLHADGYSSNGMLIDLGLAPANSNSQSKRTSISVVVQLISACLFPGSTNVDLKLVPRCSVGCCQRPLEAPNTIKMGSTLMSKPDLSKVVSITPKGELCFCARVMDVPSHVGMTHFNLLVRAVDRSALALTGTPPLPTTLISSDFVVYEKKSKPLRWLQLRCKLAARDEDLENRSSWVWPSNTTYATLPPDRTVIPDYAFIVRWIYEYCISSFPAPNNQEQISSICKRVLRLFPGVIESIPTDPADSLSALENSFIDACTYALENVGTESTDELQSALLRIIVDAVATGPAELLSIARFRDLNGMSLLHYTAVLGYLRIATAVLSWSADPDALDVDGNTALLFAAEGGFKNFCLTLVQKGAKIDQSNMYEETPLIVATREKKVALHDILTRSAASAATSSPPKSSSAAALLAEASTAPLPPPLFQSPSVSATTSPVTSPPTSPPLSPRGSLKQKKINNNNNEGKGSASPATAASSSSTLAAAPSDSITSSKSSEKLYGSSGTNSTSSKGISSFFSRLGRSDKTPPAATTPPPQQQPSQPTTPSVTTTSTSAGTGSSQSTIAVQPIPSMSSSSSSILPPTSTATTVTASSSTNAISSTAASISAPSAPGAGSGSGDEKSDKESNSKTSATPSKTPAIVTPLNLSGTIPTPITGSNSTSPLVSPVAQPPQQPLPREDSDTGSDSGPPASAAISPPVSPAPTTESGGILSLFALGGSKKEKDKEKEREKEKEKEKEREKLLKEKEREKEREREKQKEKERKEREERERKEKEKMEKEMKRLKEREKKEKEKRDREEKEKKEKEEKERKEKERKERERVEKEQKKQQQLQEKADKEKKEKERKDKEKVSIPAIATGGQPGGGISSSKTGSKVGSKKTGYGGKNRKSDKKPGSRHVSIQRPSSSRRPPKKTDIPISMRALSLERSSSDSDDSDDYYNAKEAAAIARSEQIKALILASGTNVDPQTRRPYRPAQYWSMTYFMRRQEASSMSLKRRLAPRSRSWNSLNRSALAAAKTAFSQKQGSPTERRKRSASSGSSNAKRMIGAAPTTTFDAAAPSPTTTSPIAAPAPRLLTLMRLRKPLSSLLETANTDQPSPNSGAGSSSTAGSSTAIASPISTPQSPSVTGTVTSTSASTAGEPKPSRPKASTLRPSSGTTTGEKDASNKNLSTSNTPSPILISAATLRPSTTADESAPVPEKKWATSWEELDAMYRAKDEAIAREIELSLEADVLAAKARIADAQLEPESWADEVPTASLIVNEVNRFYDQADPEKYWKEDAEARNALASVTLGAPLSDDVLGLITAVQFDSKLPYSVLTRHVLNQQVETQTSPTSLSASLWPSYFAETDPLILFAAPHERARMIYGEAVMKAFEIFRTASSNPDPRELFAPVQGLGYGIYGPKYSYLATTDASKYDLDVVDEGATPLPQLANEVTISRMVSSHPNILKIYSAIYQSDPPEGTRRRPPGMGSGKTPLIWTVSEHTGGGTLKQLLESAVSASSPSFPEEFVAFVAQKIIYALIYLHEEKKVLHRFLSPTFVRFTTEGQVKVAMSTMSVQLSEISTSLSSHDAFNDVHIDIWSLGWLILHMVNRDSAWFDLSPHVVAYLPNRPSPTTVADKASAELSDFLKYCLIEPQSASTLLSHPFLSKAFSEEQSLQILRATYSSIKEPPPNVTLSLNGQGALTPVQLIPLGAELESESPFELPPSTSDSPPPPPAEPEPDSDDPGVTPTLTAIAEDPLIPTETPPAKSD